MTETQLIMSCHPSKTDLQAIQQGYTRLDANLIPPTNFAQLKRLKILNWLIQSDRLNSPIAIPLRHDGQPLDPDEPSPPTTSITRKVASSPTLTTTRSLPPAPTTNPAAAETSNRISSLQ
jgi:hypothetical protein